MAKLVVHHDQDPAIGIVLRKVTDSNGGEAGWQGFCTQCRFEVRSHRDGAAVQQAQAHVDSHESAL